MRGMRGVVTAAHRLPGSDAVCELASQALLLRRSQMVSQDQKGAYLPLLAILNIIQTTM